MYKSAETVRHSMVSCIECIVEYNVFNKTLFETTARSPEKHRLVLTICRWICLVLESRIIVAILLGGNLEEAHSKRVLAERCLIAAAVQLGGWQAYIGHLCSLCKHHCSDRKWEISFDCIKKDAKSSCSLFKWKHQAHVLYFSCIPEKVNMNQKGINQKWYSIRSNGMGKV